MDKVIESFITECDEMMITEESIQITLTPLGKFVIGYAVIYAAVSAISHIKIAMAKNKKYKKPIDYTKLYAEDVMKLCKKEVVASKKYLVKGYGKDYNDIFTKLDVQADLNEGSFQIKFLDNPTNMSNITDIDKARLSKLYNEVLYNMQCRFTEISNIYCKEAHIANDITFNFSIGSGDDGTVYCDYY